MAELKGNIEANNTPVIVTLNGIGARGEKGKDGRDGRDGKDGSDYIITSADYAEIAALVPQYDDTEVREEIADLAENKADKSEIPVESTFSLLESRTLDATATEAVFRFAERYNGILATVLFPSNISGTYYASFGATSGIAATAGNVSNQHAGYGSGKQHQRKHPQHGRDFSILKVRCCQRRQEKDHCIQDAGRKKRQPENRVEIHRLYVFFLNQRRPETGVDKDRKYGDKNADNRHHAGSQKSSYQSEHGGNNEGLTDHRYHHRTRRSTKRFADAQFFRTFLNRHQHDIADANGSGNQSTYTDYQDKKTQAVHHFLHLLHTFLIDTDIQGVVIFHIEMHQGSKHFTEIVFQSLGTAVYRKN